MTPCKPLFAFRLLPQWSYLPLLRESILHFHACFNRKPFFSMESKAAIWLLSCWVTFMAKFCSHGSKASFSYHRDSASFYCRQRKRHSSTPSLTRSRSKIGDQGIKLSCSGRLPVRLYELMCFSVLESANCNLMPSSEVQQSFWLFSQLLRCNSQSSRRL